MEEYEMSNAMGFGNQHMSALQCCTWVKFGTHTVAPFIFFPEGTMLQCTLCSKSKVYKVICQNTRSQQTCWDTLKS